MGKTRTVAAFACTLAFGLTLAGCAAGPHQIIDQTDKCTSCHSEEKTTYDNVQPSKAEQVASTVTVKTTGNAVWVCEPVYTKEDGSYFVPRSVSNVSVSDGSATVELQPGTWVLAIDNGDTATSKLVTVSDGGADSIDL